MPFAVPATLALNLLNTGFVFADAGDANSASASAPASRATAILVLLIPGSPLLSPAGPRPELRATRSRPPRHTRRHAPSIRRARYQSRGRGSPVRPRRDRHSAHGRGGRPARPSPAARLGRQERVPDGPEPPPFVEVSDA